MASHREEICDVLAVEVGAGSVELTPAGVVHDDLSRCEFPPAPVEVMDLRDMSGVVHLVADAEDSQRWVVSVVEDGVGPVVLVHGEVLLLALLVGLEVEADFGVDEDALFVGGLDEFGPGDGAVEAYQVEAVFLGLADILHVGLEAGSASHVGVFVGGDSTDAASEVDGRAVDQNRLVLKGLEFAVAEALGHAVRYKAIEHGGVRTPGLEGAGVEARQPSAIKQLRGAEQWRICGLPVLQKDCGVGELLGGGNYQQAAGDMAADVEFGHRSIKRNE